MLNKKIEEIYQEYLPQCKSEITSFNPNQLKELIKTSTKRAKLNYKKLANPKTSSIETYISIWVRNTVDEELIKATLKKVTVGSGDSENGLVNALSLHLLTLPLKTINLINNQIYTGKLKERIGYWKKVGPSVEKAKTSFVKLAKERNILAKNKGYSNYVDMRLKSLKISKSEYNKFLKNTDNFIKLINKSLPKSKNISSWFYSKHNLPCFICQLATFPIKPTSEIVNLVEKEYPIIYKYQKKIDITKTKGKNDPSNVLYIKETDRFKISINKSSNSRHQAIDLIHELSHVVYFLNNLSKNINPWKKGKYQLEKEVLKIANPLIKKISINTFHAYLSDTLLTINKTLFEIELYRDPNQNLEKLYAKTFNRCFYQAKQKTNPFYLLDETISMKPLSNLPHAMAHVVNNK